MLRIGSRPLGDLAPLSGRKHTQIGPTVVNIFLIDAGEAYKQWECWPGYDCRWRTMSSGQVDSTRYRLCVECGMGQVLLLTSPCVEEQGKKSQGVVLLSLSGSSV